MKAWVITDRGAVRQQNQDSVSVITPEEGCGVAVVCDGMGGAKAGNVASSLAVETFLGALQETAPPQWGEQPEALLERSAVRANRVVFERAVEDPTCAGMGTTIVAAMVLGEQVHILNIGDSRAYYISEDGGIRRITRDHSVVEDLVSRGEISREAARLHPQKNLITRALGAEPETESDLYSLTLGDEDYLLLCSDGLSNQMDDQEIAYEVLHGGPVDTCCQRLLQLAMSRGAPDNVTVVLLQK